MSSEEKEVPVGEVGELWVKGPNVFLGYHNNPEGTRNALTKDGYFKTGQSDYERQILYAGVLTRISTQATSVIRTRMGASTSQIE